MPPTEYGSLGELKLLECGVFGIDRDETFLTPPTTTGKNVLYHTFEDFVTELQYLDTSSAVIMLTMATCKSVDAETETWLASPSKNSAASGAASSSGPSASGRKVSNMGSSPARSASKYVDIVLRHTLEIHSSASFATHLYPNHVQLIYLSYIIILLSSELFKI